MKISYFRPSSKQSIYDRTGVSSVHSNVGAVYPLLARQRASFLVKAAQHSGDWLSAVPISACSLRSDDKAVPVAVGVRSISISVSLILVVLARCMTLMVCIVL